MALLLDLTHLPTTTGGGPQWGHESDDLDLTLLAWTGEQGVAPHTNAEVDVLLIAVAGVGEVRAGHEVFRLQPGQGLLIPKGSERSIRCVGEQFAYLSVHRRRRGLWPTLHGQPLG
jgi:mannose-6-phosphate isomerase-like protein (cupin superfamily)